MDARLEKELRKTNHKAFTLVELLVVISIIAMLLAILVPSLSRAKKIAQAVTCGANKKGLGLGMLAYTSEFQYFPASYLYPSNVNGGYSITHQDSSHPYGYLHWSWYLFYSGKCKPEAFSCPSMTRGGAPRTNPGSKQEDWENNQLDQEGRSQASTNSITDKQAPRMSVTANAAIIPRNKFTTDLSGGQRVNRFVRGDEIRKPSSLILATEFYSNWMSVGVQQGSSYLSKSHRPICAFSHLSTGYIDNAVYEAPYSTPGYVYGDPSANLYGIRTLAEIKNASDLLDGGAGHPINAVARDHPGPGQSSQYGGCANFIYCDGHIARKTILETMQKREWGDTFYSITGRNDVLY